MPEPLRVPLSELFSGRYDSQCVEAEGIVQSVGRTGANASLTDRRRTVYVQGVARRISATGRCPLALVDTKVRSAARAPRSSTSGRQLLGIRLLVPGSEHITVLEPAAGRPVALPVQPISTLLQFSPGQAVGHRVRVQGVATLRRPNGTVFIKDATGGLAVQTLPDFRSAPGDRLDVVGFPAPGDYLPELQNAVFQKQDAGHAAAPVFITADEALSGNYHAQLVQMEALAAWIRRDELRRAGADAAGRAAHLQRVSREHVRRPAADGRAPRQPGPGDRRRARGAGEESSDTRASRSRTSGCSCARPTMSWC